MLYASNMTLNRPLGDLYMVHPRQLGDFVLPVPKGGVGWLMGSSDYSGISSFFNNTISNSPSFNSSSPVRDTGLLYPPFKNKVDAAIRCFNQEYPDTRVVYVETYRSNALQQQYYNEGSTHIQENGMHHYGIAADLAFNINGNFTYDGDYDFLRDCLSAQGLFLLGQWDKGHVQFIPVSDQTALRSQIDSGSESEYTFENNSEPGTEAYGATASEDPSAAGVNPLLLIGIAGAAIYYFYK